MLAKIKMLLEYQIYQYTKFRPFLPRSCKVVEIQVDFVPNRFVNDDNALNTYEKVVIKLQSMSKISHKLTRSKVPKHLRFSEMLKLHLAFTDLFTLFLKQHQLLKRPSCFL